MPCLIGKAGRADAYEVVPKCNDFFTHKKRLIVDDAFRERWAGFKDKCAVLGDRCPALLMQVCPTSSAAAALQGGRGSARPPCSPCIGLSRSPAPPRRTHRQFNGTDTKAGLCFVRTA